MDFRWIPGRGIDLDAIERMKQNFVKPSEAPPEGWFADPRNQRYFTQLLDTPVDQLSHYDIGEYLHDTGGGIKNFGLLETWSDWFKYLLPYILFRISEDQFLTLTIDYFLNLYPDRIPEEYSGFRDDVLLTLPQAIMRLEYWADSDLANPEGWFSYDPKEHWCDPLWATMFFCLKHLTPDEIPGWVESIAQIEGEHWRTHIHNWLIGAQKLTHYNNHPDEIPPLNAIKEYQLEGMAACLEAAEINWIDSYLVFTGSNSAKKLDDYISQQNFAVFWRAVSSYRDQFDLDFYG